MTTRTKPNWMFIARCGVSAVCFAGAAVVLILTTRDGWGWLIFAGVLSIPLFND